MIDNKIVTSSTRAVLLAGLLAGGIAVLTVTAQSPAPAAQPTVVAAAGRTSPYRPSRFPGRANTYYGLVWGVDDLGVKSVESGEIIRFTYRVLNADKAKMLNDKKLAPALIAPRAGVKLVVPQLEKIGQLRQSGSPVEGKAYWMAFSNKGRLVKRGDRVIVQIGQFRADGLVVE